MRIEVAPLHSECPYYLSEYNIGFRKVAPKQGDYYVGKKHAHNTLVFMLDGAVEFSYDEYSCHRFQKGDLIFIPQASEMYGTALTDADMLVLTYDLAAGVHRSNCMRSQKKFDITGLSKIAYDFSPLPMTAPIMQFAQLLSTYIDNDYRCHQLHELKQKELFILMEFNYTHKEIMQLFYPIIGVDMDFRTRVLKIAHEQLTVDEYAKRLHMSPRNFTRKFNVEFGQTVHKWLLQRKIVQIRLKLSMPHVSVADILEEFKFSDVSNFYRFCREHYGYTSKELMRQLRGHYTL